MSEVLCRSQAALLIDEELQNSGGTQARSLRIRGPLREDVRRVLLDMIIRGDLPAGSAVNERRLAEELGISRTPLREALLHLEREGLVELRPRRGWAVVALTRSVAEEVYPILAELEGLAMRESDLVLLQREVSELKEINGAMEASKEDPVACQQLDDEFHCILLSTCQNRRLLDLIASLKRIVHRFEYAYMRDTGSVIISVREHAEIISAVESGAYDLAARLLRDNWLRGMRVLLPRLRETRDNMSLQEV